MMAMGITDADHGRRFEPIVFMARKTEPHALSAPTTAKTIATATNPESA